MDKICFYVPETHLKQVKQALFHAGAGNIGHYEQCAWQTLGEGQYKPLEGSDPHIGKTNTLQKVAEYKVELVCGDEFVVQAVAALRLAHPYEEPAYQVWLLDDF